MRCSPSHNLRVQCYIESHTDNFTTTGWSSPMPTGLNTSTFYQPDALVAFHYADAGVWLGFANVCEYARAHCCSSLALAARFLSL